MEKADPLRLYLQTLPRLMGAMLGDGFVTLPWRLGEAGGWEKLEGRQGSCKGREKETGAISSRVWFLSSRSPRRFEGATWELVELQPGARRRGSPLLWQPPVT